MQTNVDAEVIQLSVYCDIIIGILKYIEEMSINKVMVFAYILTQIPRSVISRLTPAPSFPWTGRCIFDLQKPL